jgi:hypothetical protein
MSGASLLNDAEPKAGLNLLLTASSLGNLTPDSFDLPPRGPILSPVDPTQEDSDEEDEEAQRFDAGHYYS